MDKKFRNTDWYQHTSIINLYVVYIYLCCSSDFLYNIVFGKFNLEFWFPGKLCLLSWGVVKL